MEKELKFDEFGKTSYDDWKKQAEATLKGASFDKKLISKTIEKIDIQPFYQQDIDDSENSGKSEYPGYAPYNRGISIDGSKRRSWLIAQELSSSSTEEFNKKVTHAIVNGLEAINLKINTPDTSLFIKSADDLATSFANVDLTKLHLIINAGKDFVSILQLIKIYCEKDNIPTSGIKASVLIDPVRDLAVYGSLPDRFDNIIRILSDIIKNYSPVFPGIKLIGADSTIFHNAGASAVQELALSIATGTEYLRQLIGLGHKPENVINQFHFSLSVSSNFFMEIAKIKTHRLLWNAITNEFGLSPNNSGSFIEAQNSIINKSLLDKHSNILRSTGETMASILGGADIISSFKFDKLDNGSSDFGDRIARNIQHVLKHEAHLLDTIDPAGGTWFIENLVNEISQKAWSLFQDIESRGGIVQSLRTGYIQELLLSSLAARTSSYHTRKESLLGVNVFANTLESIKLENYILNERNSHTKPVGVEVIEPVIPYRFAEEFENFRYSVYEKSRLNNEPGIFIANFGKVSEFAARMDFSSDFFRIGGFSILNGNQYEVDKDGIASALQDFHASGFKAMVICSSDSTYPLFVEKLANNFKRQNPDSILILAGLPSDLVDQFRASGIDEFIHIKSDILAQLKQVLSKY